MKSTSFARYGWSATLVAGGLFAFAPAAGAIPGPSCDPEPSRPILTVVEEWVTDADVINNDGRDCIDIPSRNASDAGEDGGDSRISNEVEPDDPASTDSQPAPEEEVAEDSSDPFPLDAQPPAQQTGENAEPESDSAMRSSVADAVLGALGFDRLFSPNGGEAPAEDHENFFMQLEAKVVDLLKMF